jgi:hypothetical protein
VVEWLGDELTRSLRDFTRALCRAYANILSRLYSALPDVFGCAHGMQGYQVASTFAHAFRSLSGTFGSSLSDVTGAVPKVFPSARLLRLLGGLRRGWRRGGSGILTVGGEPTGEQKNGYCN